MTFLTLYHGGDVVELVPILPGADLSSDLSCNDQPPLVYASALSCNDDTGVSLSSALVCASDLPVLSSRQVCEDSYVTLTSRLACGDSVDALTLSTEQACDGPPVFYDPAASWRQGRFFLL